MQKVLRIALAAGMLGLLGSSTRADDQGTAANTTIVSSNSNSNSVVTSSPDWGFNDGCCCDPIWSVAGGAVFMSRSTPGSQQIVHPVGGATTVSNASDFNFDFSGGPEVTIERKFADGNSLELRYFGGLDWASNVGYGAIGNVQIGSFSNFGSTDLTANEATRLNSAELNWLHPVTDRITFLAGARWLDLHDELQYHISFPALSAVYDWNESNRLYGGQLGAKLALWKHEGPFSLDAVLKAGVFANSIDNSFNLVPSTGGSFLGGDTGTATSFIGEIDVIATYTISRHISLQGGYQMLWIDRLSLATNEAAAATQNSTQNGLTTSGDIFAYGATAGIAVTW